MPQPGLRREYFHTNTQLFSTVDKHNIGKIGSGVTAPWNLPQAGATPTMNNFVTDYASAPSPVRSAASHLRRVRADRDRLHA